MSHKRRKTLGQHHHHQYMHTFVSPSHTHQIQNATKKTHFLWTSTSATAWMWKNRHQSHCRHSGNIFKSDITQPNRHATSVTLECHVSYFSFSVCLKIWLIIVIFFCSCQKKDMCMLLYPEKKLAGFDIP